jgi:hypothetical protein
MTDGLREQANSDLLHRDKRTRMPIDTIEHKKRPILEHRPTTPLTYSNREKSDA